MHEITCQTCGAWGNTEGTEVVCDFCGNLAFVTCDSCKEPAEFISEDGSHKFCASFCTVD